MRVFVAGATGAVGKHLVPLLVAQGHEVVGTTRSREKAGGLRAAGARAAVVDVLDRETVAAAVLEARPEVIVHQATALAGDMNARDFDRLFAATNRLRTEGTDNLIAAGRAAGTRRIVAQSYAGWPYARSGSWIKTEEDPLDPEPVESMRESHAAIRNLEAAVVGAEGLEGIALRYGGLYGPDTSIWKDGAHRDLMLKRRFPIVGSGTGIWCFLHIDDAASATAAALERGDPGVYNVVDDEPAPATEWLPYLASVLGAKPPRHVPAWLGRLAAGEAVVMMMTEARGASNAKAKRDLGWKPAYPSWREGFKTLVEPEGEVRAA